MPGLEHHDQYLFGAFVRRWRDAIVVARVPWVKTHG